jgi:peptidylprolyl isomerase
MKIKSTSLPFITLLAGIILLSGCTKETESATATKAQTSNENSAMASTGSQPVAATNTTTTTAAPAASGAKTMSFDLTADPATGLSKATVVMTTTKGVIKYKFYTQDAPVTVKRMAELINSKFYDNLIFHRVVPGFVVQGGDPQGTGVGGSGTKLKAEFNKRKHVEGTVAMARAQDPNSADSQFYICLGTHPHLDNNYTVFGQVTEGMDVVKKIQMGDKMTSVVIQ